MLKPSYPEQERFWLSAVQSISLHVYIWPWREGFPCLWPQQAASVTCYLFQWRCIYLWDAAAFPFWHIVIHISHSIHECFINIFTNIWSQVWSWQHHARHFFFRELSWNVNWGVLYAVDQNEICSKGEVFIWNICFAFCSVPWILTPVKPEHSWVYKCRINTAMIACKAWHLF